MAGFTGLAISLLLLVVGTAAPATGIAITVPYSSTAVADGDLDGNPATGAWSDAATWSVPLENGQSAPYGSATLMAKHDGTYVYFRIDGKIDTAWVSASGNHFWLGMELSSTGTSHHSGSGVWDGVFFGESGYTPAAYPPIAIDTNGFSKPPAKDTSQNDLGKMAYSGTAAPYSFTAEWKRPRNSGDTQDVALADDGTTSYNFFVTTDSDGGGSQGGGIDHSKVANLNTMRLAAPPSGDTTPPTASITAPTTGALVRGTVSITATASDNVGVTKVEFYVDAALKGSTTASPYSYSWDTTTAADGSHALVAKAYDAANNVGTSATITVSTDNTLPTAAVTAPTAGVYLRGIVTITATASDANGITQVGFYLDAGLLGTDASSPYSFSWDTSTATEALHALAAKATDTAGNVGTSASVSVTVDRTAPLANAGPTKLVSPGTIVMLDGSGSSDANGIANYTWTFADGSLRTLYTAGPSYTFNNLGNFQITLVVADAAGNTGTDTTWVNVTADTQPPVARTGAAQAVLQGTLVTLNGTRSTDDVGIANYTWTFTDGTAQTLWDAVATYRFLHVGNIQVTLTVRDFSGKTGSAMTWVNVSADTVAPTARAGPDQVVDRGSLVTWNGTQSSDNVGVANLTWSFTDAVGVTLYGPNPAYRFLNVGNFSVTLTVRDYAGNSGVDATWVNVTPDAVPPVAVIQVSPSQSIDIVQWITLNGTNSTDNVGVVNYTWTFTDGVAVTLYGPLATYRFRNGGNTTVTLTVSDLAGNTATAAAWVNVSAVPVVASPGPDRSVVLGHAVLLDGSSSSGNGGIVNFTWRVQGTSVVLYEAMTNYTPTAWGLQTVDLTVRDAADLTASSGFVLTVIVPDVTPPGPLAQPSVAPLGPGSVRVTWAASTVTDLAGYVILRSDSPTGPFIQLNAAPVTNTSYVDDGLLPGQTYYYEVVAVDLSGNASQASPAGSGTAGLEAPGPFDWLAIRWMGIPAGGALAMAVMAILARRESRKRRPAKHSPPKEDAP